MKKSWIVISLFPLTAFCQHAQDCLFDFAEIADEALTHITFDDEESSEVVGSVDEFDSESVGIFENKEDEKEAPLPWASDERTTEGYHCFIEDRNSSEEFDEAFAYEVPNQTETNLYRPTFERVPQSNRHLLFGRPRVVQAKPKQIQEEKKQEKVERAVCPARVSKKEERRRLQPKTVAKKEQADQKVARRSSSKIQAN